MIDGSLLDVSLEVEIPLQHEMIENTKFETSTPKVKPATSNEVNDAKILPLKTKSRKDKKCDECHFTFSSMKITYFSNYMLKKLMWYNTCIL